MAGLQVYINDDTCIGAQLIPSFSGGSSGVWSRRFASGEHAVPIGSALSVRYAGARASAACFTARATPSTAGELAEWVWMPGSDVWSCALEMEGVDDSEEAWAYTVVLDVRSDEVRSHLYAVRVARQRVARRGAATETAGYIQSVGVEESVGGALVGGTSESAEDGLAHAGRAERAEELDFDLDDASVSMPKPTCEHGDALRRASRHAVTARSPYFTSPRDGSIHSGSHSKGGHGAAPGDADGDVLVWRHALGAWAESGSAADAGSAPGPDAARREHWASSLEADATELVRIYYC